MKLILNNIKFQIIFEDLFNAIGTNTCMENISLKYSICKNKFLRCLRNNYIFEVASYVLEFTLIISNTACCNY